MKKLLFLCSSLLLFSCSKDDDGGFIAPVIHTFELTYNESHDHQAAAGAEITLVNNDDGKAYTTLSDEEGVAHVELIPGTYQVSVTKTFTSEEYLAFSGVQAPGNVTFNASVQNLNINASTGTTELELVTGKIGDLIIKQIYYSGSHLKLGASFRDQFIEIHNNSNETLYLDGLHVAQVKGTSSVPSNLQNYHLPTGQYDWSKSIGQEDPENANSGYVYLDEVLRIPGGGQEYPLASGKSVIIAATALNHKAPLTVVDDDGESKTIEVPEPERTIDLSNAVFEAYYRPFQEAQGETWMDTDLDNPASANMDIAFKSFGGKDLILDVFGREALVIFFAEENEFAAYGEVPLPSVGVEDLEEDTSLYKQVPTEAIIDAVELNHTDPSRRKPKALADELDAGDISNPGGNYSSESVIRKVAKDVDGKKFYQDTNNSTNDFMVLTHPEVIIE